MPNDDQLLSGWLDTQLGNTNDLEGEWAVDVIDCDQTFDANTTSPYPASSGALRTPVFSSIFYISVILTGMVSEHR